jgi:hypothetical protein
MPYMTRKNLATWCFKTPCVQIKKQKGKIKTFYDKYKLKEFMTTLVSVLEDTDRTAILHKKEERES